MKSRNNLSDVERSPVGNDPLDLHFKNFHIKRLILKHFWWFQSKLNYYICINLITLREPIPVQSGESLKFAVAQFSWLHRCMLICFNGIYQLYVCTGFTQHSYMYNYVNGLFCMCNLSYMIIYLIVVNFYAISAQNWGKKDYRSISL